MNRRDAITLLAGAWALEGLSAAALAARALAAGQPADERLTSLTLVELVARIERGRLSPVDVVGAYLERIDRVNPALNAYVTVTSDRALARARQLTDDLARDRARAASPALAGAPIAHKDLFDTAEVRTTGGSRLYANRVPSRDAALVARLHDAGAIVLGKTNTHELGGGVTTINPFFGTTRNPRDRARVPGGSSGGSAAAVAAELAVAATGSDTGGSIRIPAAFCGCVGFKPTHGVIDTQGLLGASPTFDHAGLLARTVRDVDLLFRSAVGGGAMRAALDGAGGTGSGAARDGVRGLRVGVPRRYFFERLDDEVSRRVEDALSRLRAEGADVRDVEVPVDDTTMARVFDPIVVAEIRSTYEAAWRARPELFSEDFAGIFDLPLPSRAELAAVHRARGRFAAELAAAFDTIDVLATPTVPTTAPLIDGPIDGARILRLTWPFNAAHTPALSLPCGPPAVLPVGLQLVGAAKADLRLLAAGTAVQAALD